VDEPYAVYVQPGFSNNSVCQMDCLVCDMVMTLTHRYLGQ